MSCSTFAEMPFSPRLDEWLRNGWALGAQAQRPSPCTWGESFVWLLSKEQQRSCPRTRSGDGSAIAAILWKALGLQGSLGKGAVPALTLWPEPS